ncbi:L-2-hydroxyglutarate oxidase [Agarivorans sp. MS3-6]|uniref:L-2-hydroxyglutarate oxidase n=1 Tax=Agarivorans sp. TSD2052 TaxID=2937286 RepID=UPI00200E64FB|nr:L-2-hydroxyglutarate oxidase [Agarivorans sp. TSD2052]UPW17583.1 L-2-hydroxyglutarate oxidase [Agarivorans sp. TSD2052]
MSYDYTIIGGGIVGLSTAWQLQQRHPKAKILLIEKEAQLAFHQTGHNSGVIHAGVYYQPGSLKAQFCKQGLKQTIAFCQQYDIAYQQCGKLLVASNTKELQRMDALSQRCIDNGIKIQQLNAQQLNDIEPNITGLGAIKVEETGIVNYQQICTKIADLFTQLGGEILLSHQVVDLAEDSQKITISTQHKTIESQYLIACGGLMADRLCRMLQLDIDFQIIPYRGEYYQLAARHNQIIKHLIYPIPDPELPFLGVHLTKMIDGSVTVGPNAVQGWSREGYNKGSFNLADTQEMLTFSGFWKVAKQHFRSGLAETKDSLFKSGYLQRVRKYCPSLTIHDLSPYPAGIRAQAVLNDGSLVHDFLFAQSPRSLHVCNAPSPAATSAFPIGAYICDKIDTKNH